MQTHLHVHACTDGPKQFLRSPSYIATYFIGGAMKLDPCVSAVIIGFQSTDDIIKMTQLNFTDGESNATSLRAIRWAFVNI